MTTDMIDAAPSTVGLTVRHASIGKTRGHFGEFEDTIDVADATTPAGSTATATITATSVDTGNEDRDNHLRSGDFFDAEQFPEWTFATTSTASASAPDSFTLVGDLTTHGVTRPMEIDAEFLGTAADPFGAERTAFESTTTISCKEFSLTWNAAPWRPAACSWATRSPSPSRSRRSKQPEPLPSGPRGAAPGRCAEHTQLGLAGPIHNASGPARIPDKARRLCDDAAAQVTSCCGAGGGSCAGACGASSWPCACGAS